MKKCIRYTVIVLSFAVFITGFLLIYFSSEKIYFNTMLCGVLLLLLNNILYCFERLNSRICFLFFNITMFVFLISRPTISMFRGNVWWYNGIPAAIWALVSLFVSLIFLFIGAVIAEKFVDNRALKTQKINSHIESVKKRPTKTVSNFITILQSVSLTLFYVAIIFFFVKEFEKILFMRTHEYVEIYTKFQTQLPHAFQTVADMSKYFLFVFLATMPRKKQAFIPLMLYIVGALPSLIIGLRNPIVLNVLFVLIYYLIRDFMDDKDKWLGYIEKAAIVIVSPAAIVFLGAYNYIREGSKIVQNTVWDLIVDFFYKQGVSFDVLCMGYNAMPKIQKNGFVNYTFGGFIDYFNHGILSNVLFGTKPLPSGNNLTMALESNSFAHRMSYVSRGQEYLDGHGWGSSYILENFADYGFWGIILFSLAIGALLLYFIPMIKRNCALALISLMMISSIYFIPRDAATGFLNFIISVQFILAVVFAYFVSKLFVKTYAIRNSKSLLKESFN